MYMYMYMIVLPYAYEGKGMRLKGGSLTNVTKNRLLRNWITRLEIQLQRTTSPFGNQGTNWRARLQHTGPWRIHCTLPCL
jgi:hypothetical protein